MEAREHFIGGSYYGYGAAGEFPQKPADQFVVDDLLDLPSEDLANMNDGFYDGSNVVGNSSDSSNFTVIDSCNSSVSGGGDNTFFAASRSFNDSTFSTELCVPNDDVAELEWLSTFVEDSLSFSNNQNLQHQYSLVSGTKPPTPDTTRPGTGIGPDGGQVHFLPETPLPSKSRSRRSRAAPCDWTTRLLHLSSKPPKAVPDLEDGQSPDQAARRCLHCAAEKTPQWRTGPMGPKTLCNACGVRYKSGRLVPEYRPAASPTFVLAKHSNSHRKVVELRRQKEMQRVAQQHQQILCHRSIVGLSNGYDDVLINHSGGSSYSHLISGSAPL